MQIVVVLYKTGRVASTFFLLEKGQHWFGAAGLLWDSKGFLCPNCWRKLKLAFQHVVSCPTTLFPQKVSNAG